MARIIKTIEIEGQPAVALFDTGAVYTYVRSPLVREAPTRAMIPPARVGLGGREIEIRECCILQGKIEDLGFLTDAVPVEEIGRADGHELDVLIGARTMEQWEIRLDPKTGTLDPSTGSAQALRGSSGGSSPNSRPYEPGEPTVQSAIRIIPRCGRSQVEEKYVSRSYDRSCSTGVQ